MPESILDKIGTGGTVTPKEVLGDTFFAPITGRPLGREIVKTDLAGEWLATGNGVVVKPDDTVSKFDNAVLWFRIQSDGSYLAGGYSHEVDGQVTLGAEFRGRLLNISTNLYVYANEGLEELLQVVAFAADRTTGSGYLMDWSYLQNPANDGETFLEMAYLYKLTNNPNGTAISDLQELMAEWL
jgi:hypothetical protein